MILRIFERLKEVKKSKESLTSNAIQNSFYSLATNITSKFGGLLFTILLARILLPELFGLYNLAISVILMVGVFADLGVTTALVKYLAESVSAGKEKYAEARSRLRFFFFTKTSIVLLSAFILYFLSPLISNLIFKKPEMTDVLRIGAFYLISLSARDFFSSMFFSLKKLNYSFVSEIIFQLVRLIFFGILIFTYKNVEVVFYSLIISLIISLIFCLIVLLNNYNWLLIGKIIEIKKRRIFSFLTQTTLNSVLTSIYVSINIFMLGLFIENKFIGFYSVIASIIIPITSMINLSAVFLPIFTQISGERLKRGFRKTARYVALLSIPSAICLSFIITSIIRVIYGQSYFPTEYSFPLTLSCIFMCLLIPIDIFSSVITILFTSKEKIKLITFNLSLTLILNLVLNLMLILLFMKFGAIWVIVAVSLSTFISRFISFAFFNKSLIKNFNLSIIKESQIFPPILSSIVMALFLSISLFIFNPGLIMTILIIIFAAIIYFVTYLILIISKLEKNENH